MTIFRKVANSDILANVMDLPEDLKNKEVEIYVFPHENKKIPILKIKKQRMLEDR